MTPFPEDLHQRLRQHGQDHVLAFWDKLTPPQRKGLVEQVRALDLEQLRKLHAGESRCAAVPHPDHIAPVPFIAHDSPERAEARKKGEQTLRDGEVAVLLVAGGQGSRLGFDHPKGMYAIGPVSRKPLFQIHAEKVLAASRRYGASLPFLVMTSEATDEETSEFFREKSFFGLP